MTKQHKEIEQNQNNFIIQYLRKSNLGDKYLAGYLNMILKSLLNNGEKFHFQINIRGGCWSKTFNKAYALVWKVFHEVNLLNTKVILDDHYPSYSKQPTFDAFCSYICSSCCFSLPLHSRFSVPYCSSRFCHPCLFCPYGNRCGYFYTGPGTDNPDHSKEIFIKCNGDPVFYLVGSSNFSKNTYMTKDRNINQTDVAFIKYGDSTKSLVQYILQDNDNILLKNFAEVLDIPNGPNESNEPNNFYSTFIKSNNIHIVTAPYIGSDDIISYEYKKNSLNREGF